DTCPVWGYIRPADASPLSRQEVVMRRILVPGFVLFWAVGTLRAQDPVTVAPHNFTVLLENASVRVLDFHSKSGDKIPMHSHPAYVTYSLSGSGKTVFTAPDGKTTEQ